MAAIERTTALFLAAGLSRRYGAASKLIADYRGKPLALHAAEMLASLPLGRKIAVCRVGADELTDLLAEQGFEIVTNPDPGRGLSSSIIAGVEAAGAPEALLVCLADMPLVEARYVRILVEQSQTGIAVASASSTDGSRSPPAVFGRDLVPHLLCLEGDRGARELLREARIVVAPPGTLADFDTPDDFRT